MFKLIKRSFTALVSARDAQGNLGKSWLRSKTFWVNALAVVTLILARYFNYELSAEETGSILAVINMLLRLVTTEPVGFIDTK